MRDTLAKVEGYFLKDVEYHTMRVHQDAGLYRHLEFSHNGSNISRFDLITYPGGLVFRGDMGTFVFARTPNMFAFFDKGGKIREINPGYWAQKVEAQDRGSGIWEFNQESATQQVLEDLKEWEAQEAEDWKFGDKHVDPEELKGMQEIRELEVRSFLREAYTEDILRAGIDEVFPGPDWSESDFKEYTDRFLWCLYAIVYGVHVYNTSKERA